MKRTSLSLALSALVVPATMALAGGIGGGGIGGGGADGGIGGDPGAEPDSITLTGIVRDFLGHNDGEVGGVYAHPDFQVKPSSGYGHYVGNIATQLDEDFKPVFVGGGHKVYRQWYDADNRPICYTLFNPDTGDIPGSLGPEDSSGISSADSFAQWFRDVPGVNIGHELDITFERGANGVYTFEDSTFFPIDNDLLGNVGRNHNFHFTFELQTEFTYHEGTGQVFTFTGDDDVWVFIDGQMVIDIGGVHAAVSQTVELDRLDLVDGRTYPLSFFFAERHTTESHFRIETTLELVTVDLPTVSAQYD